MEILRFILFLVLSAAFVKVLEDVLFNWQKDKVIDVVEEEPQANFDEVQSDDKDDLTLLEGIETAAVPILNEAGYNSFNDLELADVGDLHQTLSSKGIIVKESELRLWVKQASLAVQEQWQELDKLKSAIKQAKSRPKVQ